MAPRDDSNNIKKISSIKLPGKRRRGRPKKTWRKQIDEDMVDVNVTTVLTMNRSEWRAMTRPSPGFQ